MPSLANTQIFNQSVCSAAAASKSIPVAVFVGGTAGMGKAMVQAYAKYTQGRAHIVIMSRSRLTGVGILDALPKPTLEGEEVMREFVECDVSLMRNIHKATEYIKKELRLAKINYLVNTAGYASIGGDRDETEEGIDRQFAMRYYSRWKLINELVPLLTAAKDCGEEAKVMSVLVAGLPMRWAVNTEDLAMRKKYTWAATFVSAIYNDYMMEEYALRYPEISFIHISAGVVDTKTTFYGKTSCFWKQFMKFHTQYYAAWVGKSPDESAEYMLYGLFSAEKGFNLKDDRGKVIDLTKLKSDETVRMKIWEHSVEETKTE